MPEFSLARTFRNRGLLLQTGSQFSNSAEALEKANPIKDTTPMPQWKDDEDLMEWLRNLI